MVQPGEARAAQNARVGTMQTWLVGISIGCIVFGLIAFVFAQQQVHEWHQPNPRPGSLSILYGIELLFIALACLAFYSGRGLLMYLRPADVRGQLQSARVRTGHPRLYGLAMICVGIVLALWWGLIEIQPLQPSLEENTAVSNILTGLLVASVVPILILETLWFMVATRQAQGAALTALAEARW